MRAAIHRPRPAGFTLVELVVVIGIIVILLALGAAFLPGLQGNQKVQNGVDRVAQWLLISKNRAKHDGLPTGLRFLVDPTTNQASQFVYVQQPDVMSGDPSVSNSCFTLPNTSTTPPTYPPSLSLYFNNVDFVGGDPNNPLVTLGDYLELYGGGGLIPILGVTPPSGTTTYTTLNLGPRYPGDTGVSVPLSGARTGSTNWRIIRQPRRVPGEDVLTLPQDVVVDFGVIPSTTSTWSQNVPVRAGGYEILFSPSGDVLTQTASTGKILLWVRDATVASPSQGDSPTMQGNPTLVALSVRGGFLGTYPVLANTNATLYPNQFYYAALQGRSGF